MSLWIGVAPGPTRLKCAGHRESIVWMITPDLTGSRWFRRVSFTNPFTNRWTVTAANATAMLDLGIPEGLARVVSGACRRSPLSASTAATPTGTDGHLARTPTRWCSPSCCRCSPCTGSTPNGWYSCAGPWAVRARCCWARGSAQHARRVSARLARHCGRHTWQPTTAHSTAPPTGSKHRLRTAGVGVDPYPGGLRHRGQVLRGRPAIRRTTAQASLGRASRRAATVCHSGDGNYPMS